ncbi:MAG TPA: DUF6798 domain-containing protein, partial [Isosphaeraceae bacterium]
LTLVFGVNLLGLGLAWVAVEVLRDPRVTAFQPFRLATIARGLALVLCAGPVRALWQRGDWLGRGRATLLATGLMGDWTMVVATLVELTCAGVEALPAYTGRLFPPLPLRGRGEGPRADAGDEALTLALSRGERGPESRTGAVAGVLGLGVLGAGLIFLARHDTESGHGRLLAALAVTAVWTVAARGHSFVWTPRRLRLAVVGAWAVPAAALVAPYWPGLESGPGRRVAEALIGRCRFGEVPLDDVERLALWCRAHTPDSARFVGPPGPKTFRLWSRRSVMFNRAGSPYHAEGLADWAARFRAHVDFRGTTAAFARAYIEDRQGLERRYQAMTDGQRAELARKQGATHVLAASPPPGAVPRPDTPLELLHVEGRYAVYRVRPERFSRSGDGLRLAQGRP